jgi:hypothetical protein
MQLANTIPAALTVSAAFRASDGMQGVPDKWNASLLGYRRHRFQRSPGSRRLGHDYLKSIA